MRIFAVEGAPLRILAEGVRHGPAIGWDEEACLTEEQLLSTDEGIRALEAWRRGDDRVYEIFELADLAISEADDELIARGMRARPDLADRLIQTLDAHVLDQIRTAGLQEGAS